jgi:hypothetical protein
MNDDQDDPHGYIGGTAALIFFFALFLVALGAGVAIWGAIIWKTPALWVLAVIMLAFGGYLIRDAFRKH